MVREAFFQPIKAHQLTKEFLQNEMRQMMHLEDSIKLEQTRDYK